jgi:hypothetical protein
MRQSGPPRGATLRRTLAFAVLALCSAAASAEEAAAPGPAPRAALGLELGAGAKIDAASFGIENATALAAAELWLDPLARANVGLVAAASAGPAKADFELSACLGIRPFDLLALYGGLGAVADSSQSPVLAPLAVAGLRFGSLWALEACGELHFEPTNKDAMIWIAIMRGL